MEFKILDEGDMPAAKKLWKSAFTDTDAFIEFYFSRKIRKGNTIGLFSGGALACCLHLIPYTIDLRGKAIQTFYITAAATQEEYRNRGLMARLLKEALHLLREREMPFTHLYPFLHAFYEKFGWATYTGMMHAAVEGTAQQVYNVDRRPDIAGMARLYRNYTQGLTGHILRDEPDFSYMLEEIGCDDREAAFVYREGELAAYAIYEAGEKEAVCAEAVFDCEESLKAVVGFIKEAEHVETVDCPLPAARHFDGPSVLKPYGMARIADARRLLSSLVLEDASFTVAVADDFAPWNAGVFEAVYSGGRSEAVRTDKGAQVRMDIRDLVKLVHGSAGIRELAREGGTFVYDKKIVDTIERILPAQNTFVFETY